MQAHSTVTPRHIVASRAPCISAARMPYPVHPFRKLFQCRIDSVHGRPTAVRCLHIRGRCSPPASTADEGTARHMRCVPNGHLTLPGEAHDLVGTDDTLSYIDFCQGRRCEPPSFSVLSSRTFPAMMPLDHKVATKVSNGQPAGARWHSRSGSAVRSVRCGGCPTAIQMIYPVPPAPDIATTDSPRQMFFQRAGSHCGRHVAPRAV